jgi:branched-chain amino acid transport system permease protein
MDSTLIAQGLVNGVLFGGVYSLMAVGLTLIFGVMRIVNFAHGDMMVWGMYLAWLLATRLGLDPTLGFALSAAALFVLGAVVQRGLVDRIRDSPHEMQILLLLGVGLVLENVALVAFGPEPQRTPSSLSRLTLWVGPVFVDMARLVAFTVAIALTAGLWLFLRRTDLGRIDAGDRRQPVRRPRGGHRRPAACTPRPSASARRASAPPGRWSRRSSRSSPSAGLAASVTSFNIVIIGGLGSLPGAFAGGLIVSVAESLGALFLSPSMKELVSFGLLILILLLRPAGLFGRRA